MVFEVVFTSCSRTGNTPAWHEVPAERRPMTGWPGLMVLLADPVASTPRERSTPVASGWRPDQGRGEAVREIGVPDGLDEVAAWSKLETDERQP